MKGKVYKIYVRYFKINCLFPLIHTWIFKNINLPAAYVPDVSFIHFIHSYCIRQACRWLRSKPKLASLLIILWNICKNTGCKNIDSVSAVQFRDISGHCERGKGTSCYVKYEKFFLTLLLRDTEVLKVSQCSATGKGFERSVGIFTHLN